MSDSEWLEFKESISRGCTFKISDSVGRQGHAKSYAMYGKFEARYYNDSDEEKLIFHVTNDVRRRIWKYLVQNSHNQ